MILIRDLAQFPDRFRRGAVSIGNFDGVHRGHARIVERLLAMARRIGGAAVVFTFDPHPARVLRPDQAPAPLSWTARKAQLLGELGVDAVIAYPTDQDFLRLEAREFFDRVVRARLDARAMVEGYSFLFGHNRTGTTRLLGQLCEEAGTPLEVVGPVEADGVIVSSSRVREAVASGRMDHARAMLGRPHRICGRVVRGAGRGAQLGFPTANLEQIPNLLPSDGIYAGLASVASEEAAANAPTYPTAISIGPNPTFAEGEKKVECHLIGFEGWLYDQVLEIDFLERLRDIVRFDSVDRLVAQIGRDVAAALAVGEVEPQR